MIEAMSKMNSKKQHEKRKKTTTIAKVNANLHDITFSHE